jgi:SAM-dependent methyltransferase
MRQMDCWVCGGSTHARELPACDADTGATGFRLVLCSGCASGTLLEPPSDEQLRAWYDTGYYGAGRRKFHGAFQWAFEYSATQLARRIAAATDARVSRRRVLDVGCGTGYLLERLHAHGFECTGVERSAHAADAHRDGVRILGGELLDLALEPASFEVVVIWHVLEHLRDPQATLREAARLLVPGGVLVLAVPNQASWQARLFGRAWFHLDLPRHLHFFGHGGLVHWMQANGFAVRRAGTFHIVQNVYGFLQSAQNALFPGRPNRQYRLMRGLAGARQAVELAGWLILSGLLAPAALVELVASSLCGRGASSIVFATRQ